ncbi:MAG: hypothetical protein JO176_01245 [Acidimicrobiia bacterium]|nr:hypothetical protein [Pseudonocardiales bacterium]MBV9028993.1 hypothetical protein [Pseudonocardiales bacterium]MBV9283214.1 hypothetical protein [Acidimicrobiia bacterium]
MVPSVTPSDLSRKVCKWATFTVLFTLMPLGFDLLVLVFERQPISWQVVFSDPSTYLIGFGIAASGLGEAAFDKRRTGQVSLSYIIAIVLSVLTLVMGAAMYALAKAVTRDNPLPFWIPVCYGLVAIAFSLATVWTSEG